MSRRLWKIALSTVALTAAATTALTPAVANAASDPLSRPRIAAHFDVSAGQLPENVALAPDGSLAVTFARSRQVAHVSRGGATRILATLPAPADGGKNTPGTGFAATTGIVRGRHQTLYFLYATGTADLTGVWKLPPGGRPQRIAALPATGLPNGLALDRFSGHLYIADSVLGTIWRVPTSGGKPQVWSKAPELASAGFLGVNGLKLHRGAVWATNLDKGTVLRIPIDRAGRAGAVQTRATGLAGIDDIAFTGCGDTLLAAMNRSNTVEVVYPDGRHSVVLDATDGLQNPTSIAVRGNTVTVLSAAFFTATDPNLLQARLQR